MRKYKGNPDEIINGAEKWKLDLAIWSGLVPRQVSITYAAKVMQCSRQTIYNMIADGRIKRDCEGKITNRTLFDFMLQERKKKVCS